MKDPAAERLRKRAAYRLKHGIPLDAPVKECSARYATEEERVEAKRRLKRISDAKLRGTTVEDIERRKAERLAARDRKQAEAAERVKQRRAELLAAKERKDRRLAAKKERERVAVVKPEKPEKPANPPAKKPDKHTHRKPGSLFMKSLGGWL